MAKNFKTLLILALCLALSLALEQLPIDPLYNYDAFAVQFNRTYEGDEKIHHKEIFDKNYATLLKMKADGKDVVVNQFLDWNQTQLNAFNNYNTSSSDLPVSSIPLRASGLFGAPQSFDWRTLGRVTPIKNQETCGSCWSFSSTAQYESALAIATNGNFYDLAEQYAVQCEPKSHGCNGGVPYYALMMYNSTGIPPQTNYPYQPFQDYYLSRSKPICNDRNRTKINKVITNIDMFSSVSESNLQQMLYDYGPITVTVDGKDEAFKYVGSSGGIACYWTRETNHAVLLVGYNATHWFIKNSWGTNWGDKGYGYISKSQNCGIFNQVTVTKVNSNSNVGPTPTPSPKPVPVPATLNMTITMYDTGGDGWNGMVLGFQQGNQIVGRFGDYFTSGSSYGPVNIVINGKVETRIVVVRKGSWSKQIGFKVVASNGTVIFNYISGTFFDANKIFKIFCPTGDCPESANIAYYLTLTDTWGDGWNGNQLAFRQTAGMSISTISFGFSDGRITDRPYEVSFVRGASVNVIVYTMGTYSEEVGYQLRTYDGYLVTSRAPGSVFYANNILSSFCADCVNYSPVQVVGTDSEEHDDITTTQTQTKIYQPLEKSLIRSLVIAVAVLGALVLLFIISVIILSVKIWKTSKAKEQKAIEPEQSAKGLSTGSTGNINIEIQ